MKLNIIQLRAPLKMHFFRDCGVSAVLEDPKQLRWGQLSSCTPCTLRFCARHFLALTKKLLFLEVPLSLLFVAAIATSSNTLAATQKYITDEFEVTMRSGTSTANEILRMLKSGEAVTILEEDVDSQYSLVEVEGGKKGYVLNRYLVDSPSAKYRLEQLQIKAAEQQETNTLLQSEINQLQADLEIEQSHSGSLQNTLLATEGELSRVRNAAENTLDIVDKNEELEIRVTDLTQNSAMLSKENSALKNSSNMDWFLRGAGVSLVAFVLGILITRIRWRKQDSWGSY